MHFRAGNGLNGTGTNCYGARPAQRPCAGAAAFVASRQARPVRSQTLMRCGGAGRHGDDVTISVPLGTLVKDAETGRVLAEVLVPDQPRVVLRGGRGGRGNASFKSNRNRAPMISEKGEVGVETWLQLELQVVADVGIVGMPNAGKSTLLASLSSAKPKARACTHRRHVLCSMLTNAAVVRAQIAAYAFTTLVPNLGVCEQDYETTARLYACY